MKCNALFMLIVILFVFSQITGADTGPLVLFYNSAASYQSDVTSNEALPIGNGKLAAMVYGGMSTDIIQFNEDTVWAGHPHDYAHPGAVNYLQQIQDHVWAGHGVAAWGVADDTFMSIPLRQCPYQPTAELHLTFNHSGSNYRRQLGLTTATASVSYETGGVTYNRDCFASYPDNVIVVRLTASQPGQLSFTCNLTTPHQSVSNYVSGNDVVLHGAVNHVGRNGLTSDIEFESRVRILNEGGSVTSAGQSLQVSQADAVTLVLGAASNFVRFDDLSGDPSQICLQTVADAAAKGFTTLRQDQLNDYQPLFNRVTLDLGTSNKTNNPIDQRLDDIEAGVDAAKYDWGLFNADDLQLVALNFQMARYLMISGSRPGSQPLNLQGKWNNEVEPAWEGKMTLNINEEMNYWGAEVANLGECHMPLIDMVRDLSETGTSVAIQHYGADGWMVHHNTDLWRGAAPINSPGGLWPTGGAWLSMHLWWHYEYSGDTTYLADIYPLMKGAAEFFVDFLVEDPRSGSAGYFLTNPTHSPEQPNPALGDDGEIVAGTTMDSQLIRGLFTYVIEASEILDVDATLRQQLVQMRAQLPPNQIGRLGQLQEWLEDVDVPNQHRHLSPLVDLMPAGNITPIHTPALAAAAEVSLDWKGDPTNNTSWSQAWKMCCRTRLLEGNHAYMILNMIFGKSHTDNMTFSRKGGENQIDGNLGILMGTAELFLQSHQGEVFLLPALPDKMETGSVTGLRARGGFEVDITWQNHELQTAAIHSLVGSTCRIRSAWPIVITEGAQSVAVQSPGADLYEFSTQAGHTYTVATGTVEDLTAPTPDPMEWEIVPATIDGNKITMTARTATDTSEVEYYFANLTDPNHDSGWVVSSSWMDIALEAGVTYSYEVKARDTSINENETDWSEIASATTDPWLCTVPIEVDLNDDCRVNLVDFSILSAVWMNDQVFLELIINGDFDTALLPWETVVLSGASGTMTTRFDTATGNPPASALVETETGSVGANNHRFYQVVPVTVGTDYVFSGEWAGDISGTIATNSSARNWAEVLIGFTNSAIPGDSDFGSIIYKKAYGNGNLNTSTGIWGWESISASPNGSSAPAGGIFTASAPYMIISFNLGGRANSGSTHFRVDNISVTENLPCSELDLTDDCLLNVEDLKALAESWLDCNRDPSSQCGM